MMAEPYILSLSAELLHAIATFVNHTDLPTLRLVSKQIGAAIFDMFASKYLRELRCYVMDPARLQRLKAIACREHLARKIRKVTLCLDPYEKKRLNDIVLAPPLLYRTINHPFGWIRTQYSQYDAQVIARAYYIHDQYTLHNRQNPNAALIVSILWDLKVVDCPCVELDLRQPCAYDDEVPQIDIRKSDTIPNAVLNAFFSSNCTLSSLTLDGDDFLRPEALGITRVSTAESIGRKLRSYTLIPSASHLVRSFGVQGSFDRWRTFTTGLLANTERLQALHLEVFWNDDYQHGSTECVLNFTSVMLRTERLSSLTSLVLVHVDCRSDSFFEALECCRHSLEIINLHSIWFTAPGLRWRTLFERLLDCPRLKDLSLENLHETDDAENEPPRVMLNPPYRHRLGLVSEVGREDVETALRHHIRYFWDEAASSHAPSQ